LFVGDRPDIDVLGAHGMGMHAAWLNPERAALPEGLPQPEYELRDLEDLRGILSVGSRV
jgi:FMN phosphatase YigB (HAD superfamily)